MSELHYSYTAADENLGGIFRGSGEGVTVTVPLSMVMRLYKATRGAVLSGDSDTISDEEIGGFWDFARGVVNIVHEVAKSPIVRSVVGAIPGGGTVLTAVETGTAALKAADAALRKKPAVHRAVEAAAKGDAAAKRALARIPKREVAKAAALQKETVRLAKNITNLKFQMKKAGYSAALLRAIRSPRAPWRRR